MPLAAAGIVRAVSLQKLDNDYEKALLSYSENESLNISIPKNKTSCSEKTIELAF